jgi:PAP2 superfamily
MIDLELSWRQASIAAGSLIVASVGLRATKRERLAATAVFTQETGLVLGLFALWQLAGSLASVSPDGALARSRWIWHAERTVHLPSETTIQRLFLHHPLIIQFFNLYYDSLHFPVLVATLVWLFVRHRDRYKRIRTTLVGLTGACLLVQLIPVAPPRMLPETGLVDTAVRYHQSVYSSVAGFDPDQLSAMPSVHVGWALLAAVAVIGTLRSPWRWLAVLYPVMTTLAVIVTANHFWADGIVAGALLVLVLAVQAGTRRLVARFRHRRAAPAREPATAPLVVLHHDADALGNGWRKRDELAGTDDRAAQRLSIDDDAQLRVAQVGPVHPGAAEVGPGEV